MHSNVFYCETEAFVVKKKANSEFSRGFELGKEKRINFTLIYSNIFYLFSTTMFSCEQEQHMIGVWLWYFLPLDYVMKNSFAKTNSCKWKHLKRCTLRSLVD